MSTQIILHIYPRPSKANKAGLQPLYIRFTIKGKRSEYSSKKFIDPSQWHPEMMKMRGNSETARSINSYLEGIRNKFILTQTMLTYQDIDINVDTFVNAYHGKRRERQRTIITIFQNHNDQIKTLVGIDYAPGTLQRYQTSLKHTQDYIRHQYNTNDIAINKIDLSFITGYDFYLRTIRKCNNNSTVKYIRNFQKIINICLANRWITSDPFLNYKAKLQPVERNILTQEELDILANKTIETYRLDTVRDIFLFSCYTGLAYIDVKNLTPLNITKHIDGQQWIETHRQKTNTSSKIPLLPTALAILKKYQNNPKCLNENTLLPIPCNQKTNAFLKEIAIICGIQKELTFHCARHTFATTITLSNGVPIETVSKMLGHTSIRTTQHYAKITDRKVANDMQNLKAVLAAAQKKNKKRAK